MAVVMNTPWALPHSSMNDRNKNSASALATNKFRTEFFRSLFKASETGIQHLLLVKTKSAVCVSTQYGYHKNIS